MLQRFNKLSLKKLEDKTTKMEDEIIPCNQEAVYLQENDELDLTIKLNEDGAETDLQLQDEIEPSIGTIHKLMHDRQELAKKKESLKYALRTNIYPSWLSLKFQCHVNLPNPEDNDEFIKFWKDTQKTERQKTLKNLTDYFESCIEKKNKEINNVRSRTFQKLGSKTKVSAETKRELDKLIKKAQEEHTKALEAFRDNLHNRQSSSTRDTPRLEPTTYRRPRGQGTFRGMRRKSYKPY